MIVEKNNTINEMTWQKNAYEENIEKINNESRYGFNKTNIFKEVYNNSDKYNISSDTMWVDIDSMDNYQIFTIDTKSFSGLSDFIKEIKT